MSNNETQELKNILLDFIVEQKEFNEIQKEFNKEQKESNQNMDKKMDRVQYYLEETMAHHTKMFFDEQIELKSKVDELNSDVFNLKNDLIDLMSKFKLLEQRKI